MRALTLSGGDGNPSVSPDGRTVAFTSTRDGSPRIWLKQLDGGSEVRLTDGPDASPRFSPDGSALLFVRYNLTRRGGATLPIFQRGGDLYRVATVGGEPRKVVDDVISAEWSPDGQKIVFVRWIEQEDSSMTTFVGWMDSTGENLKELASIPRTQLIAPRWTPDGSSVVLTDYLFGIGGVSSDRGHIAISIQTKQVRRIRPPLPGGDLSALAWSSRDEAVYTQAESAARVGAATWGSTRVVRVNVRTGKAEVLFSMPVVADEVEVLDRGRLLFTARTTRENLRDVAVRPGGTSRWLTRGDTSDRQPIVSPDGEWVAFTSNRSGNLDLWAVSTKTGTIRRLTDHEGDDWDPAFLEGGRKILWSSNRGGHFEVWMAQADGSQPRQVSQDGGDAENPTATPDGEWIVYQSGNPKKRGLWKIRADGSQASQLVHGATAWPEISPDGKYALYTAQMPSGGAVRVVRIADGHTVPFEIKVRVGTGRARWMPGGGAIAYVDHDDRGLTGVFAQDFVPGQDTSSSRRILVPPDPDLEAESFAFTPDGARCIVAMLEASSNLMLAEGVPGVEPPRRK